MSAPILSKWFTNATAKGFLVSLQAPDVDVVERDQTTWFLIGCSARDLEQAGSGKSAEASVCRKLFDAAIIKVTVLSEIRHHVEIWRGLSSGYELYYTGLSREGMVISDSFADLVSTVPLVCRVVDEKAPIDHLLFKTVPGERTYLEGVRKVGHGSHLFIDTESGECSEKIFHRLQSYTEKAAYDDLLKDLDEAFHSYFDKYRGDTGVAGLFSGGVDSTLNQSFLSETNDAINLVPLDLSSEWKFQSRYADEAASLLKIRPKKIDVLDKGMLAQLGDMTVRTGLPLRDYNMGMYMPAFSDDHAGYVIGERADALFGAVGTKMVHLAGIGHPAAMTLLAKAAKSLPVAKAKLRGGQLLSVLSQVAMDLYDPWGYGALMSCDGYADFDFLIDVFGAEQVTARLEDRTSYVAERASIGQNLSPAMQHLELAHYVDFLCEDGVIRERQLAHSFGKSLLCPYLSGPLLSFALKIDPEDRYIKDWTTKHFLKSLLHQRVPEYPIHQKKGITGVSFHKYYPNGQLSAVWEKNAIPDFLPASCRQDLIDGVEKKPKAVWLKKHSWHAISWAVWESSIVKNPDLQPSPLARSWKF